MSDDDFNSKPAAARSANQRHIQTMVVTPKPRGKLASALILMVFCLVVGVGLLLGVREFFGNDAAEPEVRQPVADVQGTGGPQVDPQPMPAAATAAASGNACCEQAQERHEWSARSILSLAEVGKNHVQRIQKLEAQNAELHDRVTTLEARGGVPIWVLLALAATALLVIYTFMQLRTLIKAQKPK